MKTIIITGASRGLGAATARIATQLGAHVVLNARSADALADVADRIQSDGGNTTVVVGDISRQDTCQDLVSAAIAETGQLDAIVNNAGILGPMGAIADTDPDEWEHNLSVNLMAPIRLSQLALPHLRRTDGRIINVSSGASVHPVLAWGAYCVAKAGLNHFTRQVAAEEDTVTAIALRPGVVDTAMQAQIRRMGAQGMPEDEHERFVRYHEQGDLLPPELPGRALAVVALHAPNAWSGGFLSWDDDEVQALVRCHAPRGA